jgi:hypothetical protein
VCSGQRQLPAERGVLRVGHQPTGLARAGLIERIPQAFRGMFSDASTVRLREVEGDAGLPSRLLFVGLPVTIAAGALLAHLMFPGIPWAAAALVAAILAPTDTALGLAVVTNRSVPMRIRRALNVESGLNDGVATPFVTVFIAILASDEASPVRRHGNDPAICSAAPARSEPVISSRADWRAIR